MTSNMFRDKFKSQADFDRAVLLARGFAMSEVFCGMNGDVPGGELWDTIIQALDAVRMSGEFWSPEPGRVPGVGLISSYSEARECIEALAGDDWCISEQFEYSDPGELIDELECREGHCLWLLASYEEGRG